ncbi:hypothetical protein [Sulfitobacter sp. R18_1]|uniref:DUF7673 family protein n=1 Tax=Sulfitobacter sp. R18_1 TaxID=2821104 RepID=UPI001ADB8DD3|nr:hypothetical protein [Sulfitobacter sp. R18_1]MBO9432539.1 hypothetical protein [Sulfitobacter sp. R18_1]
MNTNIIQSTKHLLENAFRDTPSGKTCQLALLAACYPGHYSLEFSDLCCLDGRNTRAALNVLTYRLVEFESIESIIGPETFNRLHDAWCRDHPDNQIANAC